MENIRVSATMKDLLVLSIVLVFVQVIEGNKGKSADPQETNNVIDYGRAKDGTSDVSSGDGIEFTWTWKPWPKQENKIKFGSVLPFFKNTDNGSGQESDETEIWNKGDYHTDWSFMETIKTVKKDKGKAKTQSSVERRYLAHERNLEKSNWCFKEKDTHHNKFKKTDVCCRKRKQCRKARLAVKSGIYQCSCDIDFYRCLTKSGTAMSKSMGQLYFNIHNVVCYMKRNVKPGAQLPVQYKRKIIYHFPQ